MSVTLNEVKAVISICRTLADTIKELGEVPSGHLYARVSDILSLANYHSAIGFLEKAGLIEVRDNMLLVWKGGN